MCFFCMSGTIRFDATGRLGNEPPVFHYREDNMGKFSSGAVSMTRFRIAESVTRELLNEVPQRLKQFAFLPIDDIAEERGGGGKHRRHAGYGMEGFSTGKRRILRVHTPG